MIHMMLFMTFLIRGNTEIIMNGSEIFLWISSCDDNKDPLKNSISSFKGLFYHLTPVLNCFPRSTASKVKTQ